MGSSVKRGREEERRKEGGRREGEGGRGGVVAYMTDSLIHEGGRFHVSTTLPHKPPSFFPIPPSFLPIVVCR